MSCAAIILFGFWVVLGGTLKPTWAGTWTVDITVTEPGVTSKVVQFGISPNASDEIDSGLEEYELPPWPPAGNFETRFLTPQGRGLLKDMRLSEFNRRVGPRKGRRPSEFIEHIFTLGFQRAIFNSVVQLSWDRASLPVCCDFRLQDTFGGIAFSESMTAISSFEVTNPAITQVHIIVFNDALTYVNEVFVHQVVGQVLPQVYALQQNFPNPFNPSTTIQYSLPQAGPVSLKIYDMVGQVVRHLVEQNQVAGSHQAVWDGLDKAGAPTANGVYLYELRAGEYRARRKMLLLK